MPEVVLVLAPVREGKVVAPGVKVAAQESRGAPLEDKVALVTGAGRMSGVTQPSRETASQAMRSAAGTATSLARPAACTT